ncbi:MAG TPA: immunoglobulin domain-containing protein [Verrucomicrobiae bacterium]|nr:immunoglobulin domain-containing protein [Verrucomicrobiae bacterium]
MISKNNCLSFNSLLQSNAVRPDSVLRKLFLAALCAGLVLCNHTITKAANVLINPGAEAGDLSGWQVSNTGYTFNVSTNVLINGAGSGNLLAHSGARTFEMFDTTADSAYMYQDFAAAVGSQWSASAYAICYASNYFNPGANAHMQVGFYDASNNVLSDPTYGSGVYTTDFLDPEPPDPVNIYWIIAPPMAVDASGWMFLQATNFNSSDPATEANFVAPLTSPVLTAPAGTAYVRYQLEFDNSGTDGGDIYWDDCDLEKVTASDPDITGAPTAVTVYGGGSATFTVTAVIGRTGEKLRYQWQKDGVDLPAAGGVYNISGTTTTTSLSFTNLQAGSAGLYDVVVSGIANGVTNTIRSVPVPLTVLVLSPLQKVNALGANAGFENAPGWSPWSFFNGAYFADATDFYGTSTTPVNVYEGSHVALVGANGDRDNGFYQTVPAVPGTVWKASGRAYISSANDFSGGNTERIQIWFKDVNGVTLPNTPTYESFKIYGLAYTNSDMQYTCIDTTSPNNGQTLYHDQLARDQWVYLSVTNLVNNGGIGLGDDLPYSTLPSGDFVVPTNAALINFQVYEYTATDTNAPAYPGNVYAGVAADAVYWDDMELVQVLPVTDLKATVSSGNVNLSFSAGAGLDYAVLYKTNLSDANWTVLTNNITAPLSWATNSASTGTSYPITISDPVSSVHARFYRVQSY